MAIGKECAAKEGASDQDVANAMAFKIPDTAAGKCLHACVGERIGAVSSYCTAHIHHVALQLIELIFFYIFF